MKINISNAWKEGTFYANVGGTWKKAVAEWINVNGSWKKIQSLITFFRVSQIKIALTGSGIQTTSFKMDPKFPTPNFAVTWRRSGNISQVTINFVLPSESEKTRLMDEWNAGRVLGNLGGPGGSIVLNQKNFVLLNNKIQPVGVSFLANLAYRATAVNKLRANKNYPMELDMHYN